MVSVSRKFTLFHISLVPVREPNFETLIETSREDWLRRVLAKQFEFPYLGDMSLYWVPLECHASNILGLIERRKRRRQHLPPSLGGREVVEPEWQGAYVIIDPSHHSDGQKMAVEDDEIGAPVSLVKYLQRHINSIIERPYEFDARQLFDSSNFSEFLSKNGSSLSYIKFQFVVPNMWDINGGIDDILRVTRDQTGSENVDVVFKSRRGLNGESEQVLDGVNYASRGAGRVTAKSTNGSRFDSNARPTKTSVESVDADEEPVGWISRNLARILGRE